MKKQLSDEQIDALMRTLVNKAGADEALLTEIAESPTIWWGVQRKIKEQKSFTAYAWPPIGKMVRWLFAGGVVTATAVLIVSFFVFRQASGDDKVSVAELPPSSTVTQTVPEELKPGKDIISDDIKAVNEVAVTKTKLTKDSTRQATHQIPSKARTFDKRVSVKATELAQVSKNEEIKTDFIALSYARDPESGQIVRVKVPSSMMVSLGLVTSVKTPSAMIDAEVLVGDDGLSRAIRFIR